MAIFANVFDDEAIVEIDKDINIDDDILCLRLEDEEARVDLLCSAEVLYRIRFAIDTYLNVPKDNQTKGKLIKLQEVKQDVQED